MLSCVGTTWAGTGAELWPPKGSCVKPSSPSPQATLVWYPNKSHEQAGRPCCYCTYRILCSPGVRTSLWWHPPRRLHVPAGLQPSVFRSSLWFQRNRGCHQLRQPIGPRSVASFPFASPDPGRAATVSLYGRHEMVILPARYCDAASQCFSKRQHDIKTGSW